MRGPARGVRVVIEVDGARPRGRGAVRRGHHDDDQRRVRHGRGRGRGVVTAACSAPDQQYTHLLYEVLGMPIGYADHEESLGGLVCDSSLCKQHQGLNSLAQSSQVRVLYCRSVLFARKDSSKISIINYVRKIRF